MILIKRITFVTDKRRDGKKMERDDSGNALPEINL